MKPAAIATLWPTVLTCVETRLGVISDVTKALRCRSAWVTVNAACGLPTAEAEQRATTWYRPGAVLPGMTSDERRTVPLPAGAPDPISAPPSSTTTRGQPAKWSAERANSLPGGPEDGVRVRVAGGLVELAAEGENLGVGEGDDEPTLASGVRPSWGGEGIAGAIAAGLGCAPKGDARNGDPSGETPPDSAQSTSPSTTARMAPPAALGSTWRSTARTWMLLPPGVGVRVCSFRTARSTPGIATTVFGAGSAA